MIEPPIPLRTRLAEVDIRIWFFLFTMATLACEFSILESTLRYGLGWNVLLELVTFAVNCFTVYAAIGNGVMMLRIVKVYTIITFVFCSLLALLTPIYLVKKFDRNVAITIRMMYDHQFTFMGFWQSVAYCVYYELNLIVIDFCIGVQWFLVNKVQAKIFEEEQGTVEMGNLI